MRSVKPGGDFNPAHPGSFPASRTGKKSSGEELFLTSRDFAASTVRRARVAALGDVCGRQRRRRRRDAGPSGGCPLLSGSGVRLLVRMEPKHSAEVSKHLDKQNEALMETYRAMSHELHKLQVEEETIMRKLYELMSAEGLLPKRKKESQLQEAGQTTQENKELEL
uniref:Uncharacterized protein n=1 Tax=Leersia perrieri TaxID=77586 RepID=A0A0D9VQY0_9ORYZ